MAGPMAYFAPGKRSVTACAITCAVECRSTSRPSGEAGVTIVTAASWSIGRARSTHSPSTLAARASLARRLPIDAAISAAVTPRGYSRCEPSGSLTLTASAGLISLATISAAHFRPRRIVATRQCSYAAGRGRAKAAVVGLRARRADARAGAPHGAALDHRGTRRAHARRPPRYRRHRRLGNPDSGRDHP